MKNTPERLKALDNMVLAVKFFNYVFNSASTRSNASSNRIQTAIR